VFISAPLEAPIWSSSTVGAVRNTAIY